MNYLKLLLSHKFYVLIVGRKLKVPILQLLFHDFTKFLPVEFSGYSNWYFGPANKQGWTKAWLHHLHHNKHHYEYWILSWSGDPNFYSDIGEKITEFVVVLPMPETYVREMVSDWVAASRAKTGSYDISVWLEKNGRNMILHGETSKLVDQVLMELDVF
jgi:hypothetical protein